jgi:xanthine dehydrogenase molybdenum-binding subunit
MTVIGERIPKKDAPLKVTGAATYGHDVRLPGMLHGSILYSDYPHALIRLLDTSHAERLPGVKCVLTAADNPATKFGYGKDNTPFKGEVVRSMRDEVAGVVAVDADTAQEALELIRIEYEELPPIFTAEAALGEGAPLIHSDREGNIFQSFDYNHGDLTEGEEQSDAIVEASFRLPYVAHVCLETSVVVAQFDPGGRLTLWSTTQIPFLLQRDLSEALGIEGRQIRIIQTTIGGAFGRGLDIYPFEPIVALMAKKAGRPVRLSFSRQEEFIAAPARQPAEVKVRAGARRDGQLTFRDVSALLDVGAYVSWGAVTLRSTRCPMFASAQIASTPTIPSPVRSAAMEIRNPPSLSKP